MLSSEVFELDYIAKVFPGSVPTNCTLQEKYLRKSISY
jgi:hypothetical protein